MRYQSVADISLIYQADTVVVRVDPGGAPARARLARRLSEGSTPRALHAPARACTAGATSAAKGGASYPSCSKIEFSRIMPTVSAVLYRESPIDYPSKVGQSSKFLNPHKYPLFNTQNHSTPVPANAARALTRSAPSEVPFVIPPKGRTSRTSRTQATPPPCAATPIRTC